MIATLKLLNSYFWKTIYGPILAFVFPLILLAILGNILRLEYIYPGIIALAMMFLGVIALPLSIMELKGSSLFKYIGSSPVNPLKFTFVVIGFYAFIAIFTGVIIFFGTMIIFSHKSFPSDGFSQGVLGGIFTLKGAFSFYIGCAIHLLFVIMTGIVISTFARTPQQCLTIGLMITLPSMFLSGMVLSVDVIGESPAMNWISRLIPFRYSTANLVVAATPRDQLGSAMTHWVNTIFDSTKMNTLDTMLNGSRNNVIDQIVWPYIDLSNSAVKNNILKLYPGFNFNGNTGLAGVDAYLNSLPHKGHGYEDWSKSVFSSEIFNGINPYKSGFGTPSDRTLFNLLKGSWPAMTLNSDNNIFQWTQDWGVRKIPSVDVLKDFVTRYFQGVGDDGKTLNAGTNKISGRVVTIGEQIQNGQFGWLDIFVYQSNILYYAADRVLNILLPLTFSGLGAWYVFKNFSWSSR